MTVSIIAWTIAIIVLAGALAVSISAIRFKNPMLALFAAIPVAVGLAGVAFATTIPAPDHAVGVVTGILLAIVGIVAGSPITVAVLGLAARGSGSRAVAGQHGGIIVDDHGNSLLPAARIEVLRGGTIIGYLERLAVIASVVLGHLEIIAVLIAVKGLGRYSELDSAEVRERFIIGTLVSLVWAGACALLIVL